MGRQRRTTTPNCVTTLNYDLATDLNRRGQAERGRDLALRRPGMAFEYVDEVADQTDARPYDVTADPDLFARWYEAGRAAGQREAERSDLVGQPSEADFHARLGALVDRFARAVEHSDLWRVYWNDELTRARKEKIVQAVAGQMWVLLCERSDVDISREANVGRGPVDFKFSAGWRRRALIELKLMSSRNLRQGAEAPLPQYMISERISSAYYVGRSGRPGYIVGYHSYPIQDNLASWLRRPADSQVGAGAIECLCAGGTERHQRSLHQLGIRGLFLERFGEAEHTRHTSWADLRGACSRPA